MNKPCFLVKEISIYTIRNNIYLGNNIHQPTNEPGVIILSDKLQFDKVLQRQLPPDPDSIATSKNKAVFGMKINHYLLNSALQIDPSAAFDQPIPSRGFRRWKALPEIKDTVLSLSAQKHFVFLLQFLARNKFVFFLHKITLFCTVI
jgi:hypothetical protein